MKFKKEDIEAVVAEIIETKLVEKNKKYGDSIYDPQNIFNELNDPELLISIRLDDKMGRLNQLDKSSDKYDSELMEIVGYLLLLINYRKHSDDKRIRKLLTKEKLEVTPEILDKVKNSKMHF